MRVFVSGASGFVGRHLIRHLLDAVPDVEIVGTTHRQPVPIPPVTGGAGAHEKPRLRLVSCDLTGADSANGPGCEVLRRLLASAPPDHVYHLAGHSSGASADRDAVFSANVEGTRRLLAALALEAPLARCLFASSGYVYGPCEAGRPAREEDRLRPLGVYAESKREAERYARDAGALVARSFNHTGPGQTDAFVVPAFAKQVARIESGVQGAQIEVGNLEACRDFLDVRDVVRAYVSLLGVAEGGGTYNVCRGEAYSLEWVLSSLLSLASVSIAVRSVPSRMRPDDLAVSVGDPARLIACTGWSPQVPFSQTLQETLDWWRAQP